MPDSDGRASCAELLGERWAITDVALIEVLQTSSTRRVERVSSDQGRFAVKIDAAPDAVADGSDRVQHAVARALPRHVPRVVPDVDGALSGMDEGCRVTVVQDIGAGRPASSTRTWRELGLILARLHGLAPVSRDFAIPAQAAADELDRQAEDYPFADGFRSLIRRVREIEQCPAATIHGEVNLSNVRQRETGELALVDWDAAGTGPIAVDLGYPLICVFFGEGGAWRAEQAAAFYTAYARNATTVPAPGQIINAAVMHAMRYLRFADTAWRWSRTTQALAREAEITDLFTSALAARA